MLQKSYACLSRLVEDDRLIWACDKTSEYTIQSGYKTLIGQHITDNNVTNTIEIYKKIWQQKIHSKIRITSRHILHNHSAFTNMSKVRVVSRVYNTYAAMVWSCTGSLEQMNFIWPTGSNDLSMATFKRAERQEAMACIQALQFARDMGFYNREVEGGLRTTIIKVQKCTLD
ncbi:hypothetical protein PVK06_048942 [Gossypium arboreum]|uniref:Uncharacterized protein n=1 Tax=Gossypium arboreum TaxID=29729 RepID=A0ABR0MH92_GOSAR|nr:hypothetical protein PVK06_048942 [Gossypium arboreum]